MVLFMFSFAFRLNLIQNNKRIVLFESTMNSAEFLFEMGITNVVSNNVKKT